MPERPYNRAAMSRNTNRNLPKLADQSVGKAELLAGRRVVVAASAGPRLGGKQGMILAPGVTANQVRVRLDGAKTCITLHVRYVDPLTNQ